MTEILIGAAFISAAITYAWWTKVRVILLRQQLYDIRDRLFDQALDANGVEESAHHHARKHLNALARTAPHLSLPLLAFALTLGKRRDVQVELRTTNVKLQRAIESAMSDSAVAISQYVIRHTIPGVLLSIGFGIARLRDTFAQMITKWVNVWTRTDSPDEIGKLSLD